MAITYGFFNSVDGDRKYSAENIGRYLHGIVSSGVYADTSSSLQVLAGDGLQVHVLPGRAMLDYHYMENDAPLTLTLAAGGTQDRYDAIMAVLDVANRLCKIEVKQGTQATSPVVPTVLRTDTIKEYMLAAVRVPKYAAAVAQENIRDTRPDNTVCGWVHGVINQVDTSTLYAQYEAAYEKAMADLTAYANAKKAEIDSRLDSIDSAINAEDVAGVPIPTAGNAGQFPTVNAAGTGYKLTSIPFKVKPLPNAKLYLSDFTEDTAGLYVYNSTSEIGVYAKTGADQYKYLGDLVENTLCFIECIPAYSDGVVVGRKVILWDYTVGKTFTQTITLGADGVENKWLYATPAPRMVRSVNGVRPDPDGRVDV